MAVIKTAAEVEEFIGTVWHAYSIQKKFFPQQADFHPASKGEVKNVPQVERKPAINKADGSSHSDTSFSLTAVEVPLEDPVKRWEWINKDDYDVRPDLALFTNISEGMGLDLAEGENQRIALTLMKWADDDGSQEITADFTTSGFADRFAEQLRVASAQFDEDGVPNDGRRWLWCKPILANALRTVEGVIRKDFGGQADVRRPMEILEYMDWNVVKLPGVFGTDYTSTAIAATHNLPAHQLFDATEAVAIAAHSTSWVWRQVLGLEKLGPDWWTERDQWKIETRLHHGIKGRNALGMMLFTDNVTGA